LERALVEEVEWDAKSSKAGLLEMQISEALNRSHELLMQESEELYATWYDDETALEALTHELASLKQKLKQKARQLQGVREENAQLQAQIEVAVRKQRVPEAILERRQALEEVTRQARSMISAEEEELIQLELTLLDAELGP
jgi:predicted  nucleic acid-binding Zn-ribbon protein